MSESPACPLLLPAESIALTMALAQLQRGDAMSEGCAALCVLALARVTRGFDYGLTGGSTPNPSGPTGSNDPSASAS